MTPNTNTRVCVENKRPGGGNGRDGTTGGWLGVGSRCPQKWSWVRCPTPTDSPSLYYTEGEESGDLGSRHSSFVGARSETKGRLPSPDPGDTTSLSGVKGPTSWEGGDEIGGFPAPVKLPEDRLSRSGRSSLGIPPFRVLHRNQEQEGPLSPLPDLVLRTSPPQGQTVRGTHWTSGGRCPRRCTLPKRYRSRTHLRHSGGGRQGWVGTRPVTTSVEVPKVDGPEDSFSSPTGRGRLPQSHPPLVGGV